MKCLIVIAILLCGATTGCYFLRTSHLCVIDEFSNFEVKMCVRDGKPYLCVSGDRFVDSITGVKALRQKRRDKTILLYAYTGPFWCGDAIPMYFEVDVSQLDTVYFGDVLLWTRGNGVEKPFCNILRPVPIITGEELQKIIDAQLKLLKQRNGIKNKIDAEK